MSTRASLGMGWLCCQLDALHLKWGRASEKVSGAAFAPGRTVAAGVSYMGQSGAKPKATATRRGLGVPLSTSSASCVACEKSTWWRSVTASFLSPPPLHWTLRSLPRALLDVRRTAAGRAHESSAYQPATASSPSRASWTVAAGTGRGGGAAAVAFLGSSLGTPGLGLGEGTRPATTSAVSLASSRVLPL